MATQSAPRQKLTIAEIASLSGVSKPTVSKVLNGRPDVAPATRERVERVIAEHGYVRNGAARALGAGRTGLVDLVAIEIDSPYIVQIVKGAAEALDAAGLSVVLTATHDEERRHRQWLARVIDHATDGAILVLPDGRSTNLEELRRRGVPLVVVDSRADQAPDIPSVGATNFAGGLAATEYLLSLGHRRVAFIGGPAHRSTRARLAGYRTALDEAGIAVDASLMQPGDYGVEAGYAAAQALLDLPSPPSAIFAGNDMQAVGVYKALHARGLRVSDDMSVVGFDDVSFAAMVSPALTTVYQPMYEMGALAADMLLQLVAGDTLTSTQVELATALVVRESCAPYCDMKHRL